MPPHDRRIIVGRSGSASVVLAGGAAFVLESAVVVPLEAVVAVESPLEPSRRESVGRSGSFADAAGVEAVLESELDPVRFIVGRLGSAAAGVADESLVALGLLPEKCGRLESATLLCTVALVWRTLPVLATSVPRAGPL